MICVIIYIYIYIEGCGLYGCSIFLHGHSRLYPPVRDYEFSHRYQCRLSIFSVLFQSFCNFAKGLEIRLSLSPATLFSDVSLPNHTKMFELVHMVTSMGDFVFIGQHLSCVFYQIHCGPQCPDGDGPVSYHRS